MANNRRSGSDFSAQTLTELFQTQAAHDPSRPFVLYQDRSWSWAAFDDRVQRVAELLTSQEVGKGDRVAVVSTNNDHYVAVLLAIARIGAIMVPVNPELRAEEMRYVLGHAEVSGVFVSLACLDVCKAATAQLQALPWLVLLDGSRDGLPSLDQLIEQSPRVALRSSGQPDDTVAIIYTSGSTGFPKGVMHSQRSYVTIAHVSRQRVELTAEDRSMLVLPLFHVNALFYSIGAVLAAGASMLIVPRFSASTFWQTAAEHGITQVNVVESIGNIIKARPRSEFRDEHKIRVVYGVRPQAAETFHTDFHVPDLMLGFGMSEAPAFMCNPWHGKRKLESLGVIARRPGTSEPWGEARIVDDAGVDVAPGETGELWLKTIALMQGYFRDPQQTKDAFHDGWFKTGDIVRQDSDGYYHFVSRKKDVIRRRGENIAGAEIDRIIMAHPAVRDVAAIAVPSELGEDEILAVVAVKDNRSATAVDIRDWCRSHLAAHKVPRFIVFMDELPYTGTHKVAKAELRRDPSLRARAVDLSKQ